jgi:hypothetical protein
MENCCSSVSTDNTSLKKHICPVNGKLYGQVSLSTIKHHIKNPWLRGFTGQKYYFCSDPDCNVVYFGQDNSVIETTEVRTKVGIKEKSEKAIICYCYGISKSDAKSNPLIRSFVIGETKEQRCACESRNPSGKCCLSSFPKQ